MLSDHDAFHTLYQKNDGCELYECVKDAWIRYIVECRKRILEQEKRGVYTVFITWEPDWKPGEVADEEIDVYADSDEEAVSVAKRVLAKDYEPGGKIAYLEKRPRGWKAGHIYESMMVDWARNEMEIAGFFDEDSDYDGALGEAVLEMLEKFSQQGHSGSSARMVADIFDRLVRYQPLTELTDNKDEWMDMSDMADRPLWQSIRSPSAFSPDGGKTYYDINEVEGERDDVWDGDQINPKYVKHSKPYQESVRT